MFPGSYFAKNAKYSDNYTSKTGVKSMFVCRVLVGDYAEGQPEDVKPPRKASRTDVRYDSCVDDKENPQVFVIFEKNQVYPEYLIHYTPDSEGCECLPRARQQNKTQMTTQLTSALQVLTTTQPNLPLPNPALQMIPQQSPGSQLTTGHNQTQPTAQPTSARQIQTGQINAQPREANISSYCTDKCVKCLAITFCCPCFIYFVCCGKLDD